MRSRPAYLMLLLLAACRADTAADPTATASPEAPAQVVTAAARVRYPDLVGPFIRQHCVPCHHSSGPSAGIALDLEESTDDVLRNWRKWELVAEELRLGNMPPPGRDRPATAELEAVTGWIHGTLRNVDWSEQPDPGRVTLRRLNRSQYERTIRDLLGVDFRGAADFPADDVGYGFDSIGDVLSMPPLLVEKYLDAAEVISEQVIVVDDPSKPDVRRFEAEDVEATARGGTRRIAGGSDLVRVLATNGSVYARVSVPRQSRYEIRVRAFAQQAGPGPARMAFVVRDARQGAVDVEATARAPEVFTHTVELPRGTHLLGAAFVNDFWNPDHPDPQRRDRNLAVDWIEVVGPLDPRSGPLPEPHRRVMIADPEATSPAHARTTILRRLASRAYRRPVTDPELGRLTGLAEQVESAGAPFARGIQVALQAILVSPHFLFRVETLPAPDDPWYRQRLTDHELATRLSYFLWSSTPDDALLEMAAAGRLRDELPGQVARLLADPRAEALVDDFAAQWLGLRRIAEAAPDPTRFPDFTPQLRDSMREETARYFRDVLREDRSVLTFLDSQHTFVDERLAAHYGIEGVTGPEFRRVPLPDTRRGGILTHASVLTVTSLPTRTSPVKRGKWVLEELLGAPPPPPPPGVDALAEDEESVRAASPRERLAQHREKPECAVCHVAMDGIGFALENFDAVGRWRDRDGEFAIDATGELSDGRAFDGPAELRARLAEGDAFVRCLAEKLLVYALGRGLVLADRDAVDRIVEQTREADDRMSALLTAVVLSEPFRFQRGEGERE